MTPAGIEPANLGSKGEYDNHWTTGVDLKERAEATDVCAFTIYKISNESSHDKLYRLKMRESKYQRKDTVEVKYNELIIDRKVKVVLVDYIFFGL